MGQTLMGLSFLAPFEGAPGAISGSYNVILVGASYLIAAIASFAAIYVVGSINNSNGTRSRYGWLAVGAMSLGAGIWAMHFIGMMAYEIPLAVEYNPGITAISVFPAVITSAIALAIVARKRKSKKSIIGAGAIIGAGIGLMHYMGMAAMKMSAHMVYEPVGFAISILLAIGFAGYALSIASNLSTDTDNTSGIVARIIGAAIMGAAISAMHYTAMFSVYFVPMEGPINVEHTDTVLLAAASAIIAGLLIGVVIFASVVDHVMKRERINNEQFETMVGLSEDLIMIIRNGMIVFANAKAKKVLGVDDLIDRPLAHFISVDYALLFDAEDTALSDMAATGDTLPLVLTSMDKRNVDAEMSVSPITNKDGEGYFVEFRDVSAIKEYARKTLEREGNLNAVMNGAADAIITTGANGVIGVANRAAEKMFACDDGRLIGSNLLHFIGGNIDGLEIGTREITSTRADGSKFPAELSINEIHTDDGKKLVAIIRDITNRKKFEEKIKTLASTDLVTGLPNRITLMENIKKMIMDENGRGNGSILYVSINGHQRVTDTYGHQITDKLLRAVGERISEEFEGTHEVGSWGGGEFMVLLDGVSKPSRVERAAMEIHDIMLLPFQIDGNEINISCNIGANTFYDHSANENELVRGAGLAMFQGRKSGNFPCTHYHDEMGQKLAQSHQLESDLSRAVENEQLRVYYQPKINLESGAVQGMEALVRWEHPVRGMVSPVEFVPIAEKTGMIIPIGEWVLRTACMDTSKWVKKGYDLKVAVNLSGRQFEDGKLLNIVTDALEKSGLPAKNLELEVTESALMDDIDKGIEVLQSIRALGITVAIDDFGTGYSSLSYLKKLPLDTLKIDQSFVRDVLTDSGDAAIATTIVGMASCLNLKVVAEGIETVEHEKFLKDLTCEVGQGYLYSRPVPANDFDVYLKPEEEITNEDESIKDEDGLSVHKTVMKIVG